MTFVVTENCINCKHQDCVEVCPRLLRMKVQTFLSSIQMNVLIVHCVNLDCPANAIFSEDELPEGQEVLAWIEELAATSSNNITQIGEQPADRKEWNGKPNKLQYLENN